MNLQALLTAISCAVLVGCAGRSLDVIETLPHLPLNRTPAVLKQVERLGSDTFARSNNANDVGASLSLTAAKDEMSWAIWQFSSQDTLIDINVTASTTEQFYLGLSDYANEQWEISGPYQSNTSVAVSPINLSSQNYLYVAIIVSGPATASVGDIVLNVDHTNLLPTVDLQSDLTSGYAPFVVNFSVSSDDTDGTIESIDYDFDGDGTFDLLYGNTNEEHTFDFPATYNVIVRVVDNDGGFAQDSISVVASHQNELPTCDLLADVTTGYTPLTVSFTGSASDSDGTVVSYDYDLDGDGEFELIDAGTNVEYTYENAGNISAALRVTDDSGGVAQSVAEIQVTSPWLPSVIASGAIYGQGPDMMLVNGAPAIVFTDQDMKLWYTRAADNSGETWNDPIMIDSSDVNVFHLPRLNIVAGFPAVAYDHWDNGVRFVRALDEEGVNWGSPVVVVSDLGNMGYDRVDMEIINGNPAISFSKNPNPGWSTIHYIRAADDLGVSWGQDLTVATAQGVNASLCVVNGHPALTYGGQGSPLMYNRAADIDGEIWDNPIQVDALLNAGYWNSLELVNGLPAIAYDGLGGGKLRYCRATDVDGQFWGQPITLADTPSHVSTLDMAVVSGKPFIAYYQWQDTELIGFFGLDEDGVLWSPSEVIVGKEEEEGAWPSILDLNDVAAIAHENLPSEPTHYIAFTKHVP